MNAVVSALPKYTNLARYVGLLALAKGSHASAIPVAEDKFRNTPAIAMTLRAAITAISTGDAPTLAPYGLNSEIVELARTATIEGRIAQYARRVPFRLKVPREVTGASASWAGQGQPVPVSNLSLDTVTLEQSKISSIVVLTKELITAMSPASEASIISCIKAALGQFMDGAFLNPETAEVVDGAGLIVSPASIAFGGTEVLSTGATAAQKAADLAAMAAALASFSFPVWIMGVRTAMALAGTTNAAGASQFPGITMLGGTLIGAPVFATAFMPAPAGAPTENFIILVDAGDLMIADDGEAEIDASEQASLQMVTDPATGATALTSLWQTNASAIRVSRFINWQRGHAGGVVFMQVTY